MSRTKKKNAVVRNIRRCLDVVLSAVLVAMMLPQGIAFAASIGVDGDASDWSGIAAQSGNGSSVTSWSATADGSYVYVLVEGPQDSQWGVGSSDITISTTAGDVAVKPNAWNSTVQDSSWSSISGSSATCTNGSGGYVYECAIPLSALSGTPQSVTYYGSSIAVEASSSGDSGTGTSSGSETTTDQGTGTDAGSGSESTGDSGSTEQSGTTVTGNISVDGNADDWGGVPAQATTTATNGIDSWKVARDSSGNVYILAQGTASSQWDSNYQWTNIAILKSGSTISNPQLAGLQWNGGSFASTNEANGTTAGPFTAEAMIPASMVSDADSISFLGTTVSIADIPVLDGNPYVPDDKPATYDGIVIDGQFKDWDAVAKTDVTCPNSAHPNCLSSTAMVFDGDSVYIYIKEGAGGSAANAGANGNGIYAITTDLGRTLTFQLKSDGTVAVSGPEAATASHVGSQWEIRIPAADLPNYLNTISFGLYQEDPFIKDVANLNGQGSGGSFSGIVIDGSYDDWAYYPHNMVEYATSGTQSNIADSEAALWTSGSTLYGHVVSTMPAHVQSKGGDLLGAVSIAFNGDHGYKGNPSDGNFYPKFYTVDDKGNITVLNDGTRLPEGTTTVYIADARTDFSSRNYNDLRDDEKIGKMIITVSGDKVEAEFDLDLDKVASYVGQDASSFNTIDIQWGRLGQQWTSYSGTSTEPFVGISLCLAVVAGSLLYRRREVAKGGLAEAGEPLDR